ncbi:hypothetical protein [Sandaracinobacteroides saxicola]|uniref:Uncharacterized protein n=1 Tax=Sandaracinobacteroides saxicola TaxID=2759707 RepID=A0A7G5IEX5_9SPHN|nr:hypothetical protein [Sandaracinobacteroides saxicola]QMW21917.1 hypothetical protein H3309_11035 [Sandaracinobacteroides saxicola]
MIDESILRAAYERGDATGYGAAFLARAQVEDGDALLIGREAIMAEALAMAAALRERTVASVAVHGPLVTFSLSALSAGVQANLRRHLWLTLESGRVADALFVTDRLGIAPPAPPPIHRPLGELRSGQGQLPALPRPDAPLAERLTAALNARDCSMTGCLDFAGPQGFNGPRAQAGRFADARDWWMALFARVPDALLTIDRTVEAPGVLAILWRVQGHVAGGDGMRRLSLPLSAVLDVGAAGIGAMELLLDMDALEALPARAHWDE